MTKNHLDQCEFHPGSFLCTFQAFPAPMPGGLCLFWRAGGSPLEGGSVFCVHLCYGQGSLPTGQVLCSSDLEQWRALQCVS